VAVGYLQDLLRGHGYSALPDPRVDGYGSFGQITLHALTDYCAKNGLNGGNGLDQTVLADLVSRVAPSAIFSPVYLPLVLSIPFTSITRFIWLSSLFETRGSFALLNLNTDRSGLSLGILQWAQRAGQLHTILAACADQAPDVWAAHMGDRSVVDYTAKENGGIDGNGWAKHPAFELTKEPWKSKLEALCADPAIQRVQTAVASTAYQTQFDRIQAWPGPPKSERLFAFLLDLGNQFGPGRVSQQFAALVTTGAGESEIMQKLEDSFTALSSTAFQPRVRARREFFRTTSVLSDQPV
jgi:hypothetical protein